MSHSNENPVFVPRWYSRIAVTSCSGYVYGHCFCTTCFQEKPNILVKSPTSRPRVAAACETVAVCLGTVSAIQRFAKSLKISSFLDDFRVSRFLV